MLSLFEQGRFEEAIAPAHTLKGVMGNLSATPLYSANTRIVNDLRSGSNDEAQNTLKEILPQQAELVAVISAYL